MIIQRHPQGGWQINLGYVLFWDIRMGYIRAFGKVRRWGKAGWMRSYQ